MEEKEHESQIEYQKPTKFTLSDAGEGLSNEEYAKRERAVVWKLDCFIAPVMMFLMLISYLDHGNVCTLLAKDSPIHFADIVFLFKDRLCSYTGSQH